MPLTFEGFRRGDAGGGVGAHDAVDSIVIFPKQIQQPDCKPALPVIAVNYQLGDPADQSPLVNPTTGDRMTCEAAVDGDSGVRAGAAIGEALGPETTLAHPHSAPCPGVRSRARKGRSDPPSFGDFPELVGCFPQTP